MFYSFVPLQISSVIVAFVTGVTFELLETRVISMHGFLYPLSENLLKYSKLIVTTVLEYYLTFLRTKKPYGTVFTLQSILSSP